MPREDALILEKNGKFRIVTFIPKVEPAAAPMQPPEEILPTVMAVAEVKAVPAEKPKPTRKAKK